MADIKVNWVAFDTAAALANVQVSWIAFDTGATPSPTANSGSGGSGGGTRVKNRRELDELLTKALQKPTEVAVQLLLPKTPSADAIALVRTALQERETAVTKSAARQVQSLIARLQVLEREAEEEEAVVMMLLLD